MNLTDLKTLGIIIIGVVLLAIVLAFVFNSKFRKDVIAAEGEAAVLGLINVKGVVIVLLTAIFGGIFAYIIQLDSKEVIAGGGVDASVESAIEILTNSNKDHLTITYTADSVQVKINGQMIGAVPSTPTRLNTEKRNTNEPVWDVLDGTNRKLGYITLDNNYGFLSTKGDTNLHNKLIIGQNYQLNNSSLVFRIDSAQNIRGYKYWMSFGEGDMDYENEIVWKKENFQFYKTPNGVICSADQYKCLYDANWSKFYFVGIGLGAAQHNDAYEFTRIDLANIAVLESKFQ